MQREILNVLRSLARLPPQPISACRILDQSDQELGRVLPIIASTHPSALIKPVGKSQDTEVVTVDLGIQIQTRAPSPPNVDRRSDVLAVIQWGVGGASFSAEVDFARGTQVSFVASQVSVSARFAETAPEVDERVLVAAGIAWGSRAARSYPTRTIPSTTLTAAGGPVIFPVPPFAYAVQIFTDPVGAAAAGPVEFLGGPLGTDQTTHVEDIGAWGATVLANEGVKLPPSTRFIQITPANDFDVTLVFPLNL